MTRTHPTSGTSLRTYPQLPPEIRARLRPMRRAFARYWEELIDAAIAAGDVRADIDPLVLRMFVINALEKVAEWPPAARRSARRLPDVLRTLILDGVGDPTGPPRRGSVALARESTHG